MPLPWEELANVSAQSRENRAIAGRGRKENKDLDIAAEREEREEPHSAGSSQYVRRSVELGLARVMPMDDVQGRRLGSFFFMPNPKYHEVPEDREQWPSRMGVRLS